MYYFISKGFLNLINTTDQAIEKKSKDSSDIGFDCSYYGNPYPNDFYLSQVNKTKKEN